jgi:hypothetical protein
MVTAKYKGNRGNALSVAVTEAIDDPDRFVVTTYLDGIAVAAETAETIEQLSGNAYVAFSGTGELSATAGTPLSEGTTDTAKSADYTAYFAALEVQDFHVLALPITDATVKAAAVAFVKRQIEDEGKKIQLVLPDYALADHEGVISVENGVVLSDGMEIDHVRAVAWVAGATAAAAVNRDLTYTAYDDAIDVTSRYTPTQIKDMLNAGKFFFVPKVLSGVVKIVVQEDINTFTGFTPEKGEEFRFNRSVRTIFDIGTTLPRLWETSYIGKVDADADGMAAFRGDCLSYFGALQEIRAIKNFADEDIELTLYGGNSVEARVGIQVTRAFKKLYMTVQLQ